MYVNRELLRLVDKMDGSLLDDQKAEIGIVKDSNQSHLLILIPDSMGIIERVFEQLKE